MTEPLAEVGKKMQREASLEAEVLAELSGGKINRDWK